MMNRKIIGILICMLFFVSSISPVLGTIGYTEFNNSIDYENKKCSLDIKKVSDFENSYPNTITIPIMSFQPSTLTQGLGYGIEYETPQFNDINNNPINPFPSLFNNKFNIKIYNPIDLSKDMSPILINPYNYFTNPTEHFLTDAIVYRYNYYCLNKMCTFPGRNTILTINVKDNEVITTQSEFNYDISDSKCPYGCPGYGYYCNTPILIDKKKLSDDYRSSGDLYSFLDKLVGLKCTFTILPSPDYTFCPMWMIPGWASGRSLLVWPYFLCITDPICLDANDKVLTYPVIYNSTGGHYLFDNKITRSIAWNDHTDTLPQTKPFPYNYIDHFKCNFRGAYRLNIVATGKPSIINAISATYNRIPLLGEGWVEHGDSVTVFAPLEVNKTSSGYWEQTGYTIASGMSTVTSTVPAASLKITSYMDYWCDVSFNYRYVDLIPPKVVTIWPPNGATNVPITDQIEIVFSEPMDKSSVLTSLLITPLNSSATYDWCTTCNDSHLIYPNCNLEKNTYYYVKINYPPGACDKYGNSCVYEFSFSTSEFTYPPQPPDYNINSYTPLPGGTIDICRGESGSFLVKVISHHGFDQPVELSLAGLPDGCEYTFTPETVTPQPNNTISSELKIFTIEDMDNGDYSLTIEGLGGDLQRSSFIHLTISDPPEPDPISNNVLVSLFGATMLENYPPNKPTCTYDKITKYLEYNATDPDQDRIRYGISWDNDGVVDLWTGFVQSGFPGGFNCAGHTGTVGAIVEDEHGLQSSWISVVSKNKMNYQFNILFQRYLQRFPFFEKILNQIT